MLWNPMLSGVRNFLTITSLDEDGKRGWNCAGADKVKGLLFQATFAWRIACAQTASSAGYSDSSKSSI